MKKLILSIAIIATAIVATSCEDNKQHCWTLTCDVKNNHFEEYFWGTLDEAHARSQALLIDLSKVYGDDIIGTPVDIKKCKIKNQGDCEAMNNK